MSFLTQYWNSLLHLFFPHVCAGCGSDALDKEHLLCLRCTAHLPETGFHEMEGNIVEKVFYGRLPVTAATSFCFFSKDSLIQHLMHQLKYRGRKDLGVYLGSMLGRRLAQGGRMKNLQAVIPVPLHASKLKKRGYNQAAQIALGIGEALQIPVLEHGLVRTRASATQTRKTRTERWDNVNELFAIPDRPAVANKKILLVDDVLTTGATLEACGQALHRGAGAELYIATLAYAIS
jgi:ComF family protein